MSKIIKDIEKNKREIIRIEISEYNGKEYINIRVWYKDNDSGEYKPTPKGVAVIFEKYGELMEGLKGVEEHIG
jgi:hypothetical protein